MTITNRETVLAKFTQISRIPRCSKQEQQIGAYLTAWAAGRGFAVKTDRVGNILVTVPATPGREQAPTVVLQSHLDMVCEKIPSSRHDFNRDPLRLYIDGDWLRAEETTLGADNGIGIALALALAEDQELSHPKLELLFTVDEETGLTGAANLEPDFFSGRLLLNLDSEDEGVLTIGCAGGCDSELLLDLDYEEWPQGNQLYELTVAGLQGGHSGVDIHEGRGNANVLLARTLAELRKNGDLQLAGLQGGSAHNAIPREAVARLAIPATAASELINRVVELAVSLRRSYPNEPNLSLTLARQEGEGNRIFSPALAGIIIDLLLVGPDGVMAMSKEAPGVVETSINLATIREKADQLSILFSQRSDKSSGLAWLTAKLEGLARLSGAGIITGSGYPGWPPDHNSPLLAKARQLYLQMFGREPIIEIIHAGLECGIIGAKNPGIDMLSLGPTVKNPHSPEEKLFIPSLDRFCPFIRELLAALR
ncbi:MAG: aminoacyl-histidine dipeptidase [Proteobacteria bacterium]|nr:aminoacyl-histidine dipeptidase [Pseudomonadota bacterium]MBU1715689.1 aminoacyl-histidine dipeptidase [Pseudomonadota bacterium]